eukprot:3633996-Alexandrium_andersonii.AAC.1
MDIWGTNTILDGSFGLQACVPQNVDGDGNGYPDETGGDGSKSNYDASYADPNGTADAGGGAGGR